MWINNQQKNLLIINIYTFQNHNHTQTKLNGEIIHPPFTNIYTFQDQQPAQTDTI